MKTIFSVTDNQKNQRLDKILCEKLKIARSEAARLLKNHRIKINDETCVSGFLKIRANQKIEILAENEGDNPHYRKIEIKKKAPKLEILWEDDEMRVYNKPTDLLTHADGRTAEWDLVTLARKADGVTEKEVFENKNTKTDDFKNTSEKESWELAPTICHRLDRDTTGVILYAKTPAALLHGKRMFKKHAVHKTYLGIVIGKTPKDGVIDVPVARRSGSPTLRCVSNGTGSRNAETHFWRLDYDTKKDLSLVEFRILTGRTHQIRVHMTYLGYPILGDSQYGKFDKNRELGAKRQLLHAWKLKFRSTNGEEVNAKAPIPEDLQKFFKISKIDT